MSSEQNAHKYLERFELAAQATRDGIMDWDIPSGDLYLSPLWLDMLGYDADDLPPHFDTLETLLHPEDRESSLNRIQRFLQGTQSTTETHYRLCHKNGSWRWIHLRGIALRDTSGVAMRFVGAHTDITDSKQIEAAMQDIQSRYRSLYDNAPLAFVVWNREGAITGWNNTAQSLFGWSRQERFGNRFSAMFPGERQGEFEQMAYELVSGKSNASQFVSEVLSKSGAIVVIEWSNVVLRNTRGLVSEVISLGLDLTQRIQAENELQRYQQHLEELVSLRTGELEQSQNSLSQIIADSPVPIFVIDRERLLTHWNRACESSFGIAAQEVIGSARSGYALYRSERPTLAELVIPGADTSIPDLYGSNQRPSGLIHGAHEAEIFVERLGRWFAVTAAPLYNTAQEIVGAIETLQDITERRNAEQVMLEAKRLAESAANTKAEFLANMSHEIRTPMNAIIGISHLALKTDLNARQREYLEKILGAGNMLLGLINDVLDFSKIEAGMLKMESIDFTVDEVLNSVSTMLLPRAQQKGLRLHFVIADGVPQDLIGDPLRLTQVLINLVGNAIKFTEQGHVTITLELSENARPPEPFHKRRDADWGSAPEAAVDRERRGAQAPDTGERTENEIELLIQVSDTGIGMTEEQSRKLFKAFSQADTSTTRKFGGTGLGLIICKKIIEQMGGEIQLNSTPGTGTTFFFNARLAQARLQPQRQIQLPEAFQGAEVLVGDDDKVSRETLAASLRRMGFSVSVADCGESVLHHIEKHPCAVAFVDWQMPGISGIEVAAHVARMPAPQRPRFILVAAHEIQEIEIAVADTPIDGILTKPVTGLQIERLLREILVQGESDADAGKVEHDYRIKGLRVLVVDDIPTNQLIAGEVLREQGVEVEIAGDGLEAVSMVMRGAPYDAVLMDLQMPRMGGIEATQRIRADKRLAGLPIIAMTAHTLAEERDRCRAAGINDFISKPFEPDKLYALLEKCAGRNSSHAATKTLQAAPGETVTPELPGIDTAIGLKRVMNKPAFYEKVLRDFYHRFADSADMIRAAQANGTMEEAIRQAHSAKGLSATIGAMDLHAAAVALEQALKDDPASSEALEQFEQALEIVLRGIRQAYDL